MRFTMAMVLVWFAAGTWPSAQTSRSAAAILNPPWPRLVVDIRGATNGLPSASGFYPPLPDGALVPARGFGIDAGAHVYAGQWNAVRFAYGADVFAIRATHGGLTTANVRVLAPQVSLNFGTARGWSYVSGGVGLASIRGDVAAVDELPAASRSSGALTSINVGGGARWFITPHVAFTFDLRLHRIGHGTGIGGIDTGAPLLTSAAAGISWK